MKKRILSVILLLSLLTLPMSVFAEESQISEPIFSSFNSFFIPSKTAEFTQKAIDANRRVQTSYQISANEEALAEIDSSLGVLAAFINGFKVETVYQPNFDDISYWNQSATIDKKPFFSHSLILTPDDAFLTSNFIPNQSLGFTPREALGLLSTLINEAASELDPQTGAEMSNRTASLLADIYSFIGEDPTWQELSDGLFSEATLANINMILTAAMHSIGDFLNEGLPSFEPLYENIAKWYEKTVVPFPVVSNVETIPFGSTLTQLQITQDHLAELIDIISDWYAQDDVAEFFVALGNQLTSELAEEELVTVESFQETVELMRESFKESVKGNMAGPITISCWTHENNSYDYVIDQFTLTYPVYTSSYSQDQIITFFAEYMFDDSSEMQYHTLTIGAFDDNNKLSLRSSFIPQYTLSAEEGIEQREAFMDFSFLLESINQGEYEFQDEIYLSVLQQQTASDISATESWSVDLSISSLPYDDYMSFSNFDLNGGFHFFSQTETSFNKTNDIQSETSYTLSSSGDFGDEQLLSVQKNVSSSLVRKVNLPKTSETTRLGQMDMDKLHTWIEDNSDAIGKAITSFEKFFAPFN